MTKPILLSVPFLNGNEKKYVLDCLESEWVSTSGKYVSEFENAIAKFANCNGAVACVNGTAALHICLILAGIKADEEVIVPTLTFIAPINAVRYVSAHPIFMDCDDYLNMDVEKLSEFLENECNFKNGVLTNKSTGRKIKAIIPVHIFGSMCRMEEIMQIAENYGLVVIEDATEALGSKIISGKYAGKHAGTIGDFGTYSFNGNKIITCGGGGMILAKSAEMLRKAKYLTTQAKDDELYYVHNEVGYNYRLTALQAAMGLAQLEELPDFIQRKKKNFLKYKEGIKEISGLSLLDPPSYCDSNHWFYSLTIDSEEYGMTRDELIKKFEAEKIQTRPIWELNHKQKPYHSCQSYKIEKAFYYYERILNIPCSSNLTDEEINKVIDVLNL